MHLIALEPAHPGATRAAAHRAPVPAPLTEVSSWRVRRRVRARPCRAPRQRRRAGQPRQQRRPRRPRHRHRHQARVVLGAGTHSRRRGCGRSGGGHGGGGHGGAGRGRGRRRRHELRLRGLAAGALRRCGGSGARGGARAGQGLLVREVVDKGLLRGEDLARRRRAALRSSRAALPGGVERGARRAVAVQLGQAPGQLGVGAGAGGRVVQGGDGEGLTAAAAGGGGGVGGGGGLGGGEGLDGGARGEALGARRHDGGLGGVVARVRHVGPAVRGLGRLGRDLLDERHGCSRAPARRGRESPCVRVFFVGGVVACRVWTWAVKCQGEPFQLARLGKASRGSGCGSLNAPRGSLAASILGKDVSNIRFPTLSRNEGPPSGQACSRRKASEMSQLSSRACHGHNAAS